MSTTFKTLGQLEFAAATSGLLYTCPASTNTIFSTITVCNRASASTTFNIGIALAGVAYNPKQNIYFQVPINGFDTFAATLGVALSGTDQVWAWAGASGLSFNVFGQETV